MTTLTINNVCIKTILVTHLIAYPALAAELSMSVSATSNLINHGTYPKRRHKEDINLLITNFLTQNGIALTEKTSPLSGVEAQPANPTKNQATPTVTTEEDINMLAKQSLSPNARKQFGLIRNPFTCNITSQSQLYLNKDFRYVRESMWDAAKHGGFVAVCGESGAGKTTLRLDLAERIKGEGANIIVIEPYVLAAEDNDIKGKTLKSAAIAEAIMYALNPLEKPKQSAQARFTQVHKMLKNSADAGNKHVLIIEEAHSLPLPTLKHLKRFHELQDGFMGLIAIILIGQNELALKLSEQNQEVREVVQRCEVVTLEPITPANLADYLAHRAKNLDLNLNTIINSAGIDAVAERLTQVHSASRGKTTIRSLLYPLAVGNFLTAAINKAAELGADIVDADIIGVV